ncbi:MAG: Gfo/Idh/MocA family oxidoreductase [Candidatus Latescibacteria bacterium]|nr:Gfo/Idh/MocA family oxidoreductase [Candidatus Latescibacterota bacterium]
MAGQSGKVRVGIIGTGQIGKSHVRKYKEMPEVEVAAVADLREEEARRVAAEHGIPKVFTDYHEMLKVGEIDAVDVCLHNHFHRPATVAALEAGKHVYCEKPMAATAADARAMMEASRRTGKRLMVQMATVFTPEAQAARQMIERGALGRVYYAKASHYRRRGRPYVDGYASQAFVQKANSGGGALLDMGIYHMGMMVYLLGVPEVETVTASTFQEIPMDDERRRDSGYSVEEFVTGMVRFRGDVTMFFEEAWASNMDGGTGDQVMGSLGGLKLNPLTFYGEHGGLVGDTPINVDMFKRQRQLMDPYAAAYDNPQVHWIHTLLGHTAFIDTGAVALKVAEISEAMYRSAETRKEVVF